MAYRMLLEFSTVNCVISGKEWILWYLGDGIEVCDLSSGP